VRALLQALGGTLRGAIKDDCHGLATQIAYHWIYALFPGLFVLVGLLSVLGAHPGFLFTVGQLIERATPGTTKPLVDATLLSMRQALSRGTAPVLGFGLVGVMWVASNGFDVVMGGLNRAYGVAEHRPFWLRRLLAIVLVVGVGFGLVTGFELIVVGSSVVKNALHTLPGSPSLPGMVGWARWPAYFTVSFAVAVALYAIAPSLPHVSWRWTAPGALLFAALMVGLAYGFDRYLSLSGRIDKLYGTLGAFLVLMTWLYMTALAFMIGGELNGQVRWRLAARASGAPAPAPAPRARVRSA